jgi:hypothetical protein
MPRGDGSDMIAHLIVRAIVPSEGDRSPFDTWYADDHMAAVIEQFRPLRCWRSWSTLDASIHYACYEFPDLQQLREMMLTDEFARLVDDFSQTWDGKVTRTRDVVAATQYYAEQPV